jgi:hypothetical protein
MLTSSKFNFLSSHSSSSRGAFMLQPMNDRFGPEAVVSSIRAPAKLPGSPVFIAPQFDRLLVTCA